MSHYYVLWKSGQKSWIEEKDMNCSQILVEFIKNQAEKPVYAHELLEILVNTLSRLLKKISKTSCKMIDVGIKWKIKVLGLEIHI
jgi:predicted transcriptional regulator